MPMQKHLEFGLMDYHEPTNDRHVFFLTRNKELQTCPFGASGSMCSSWCPHFDVRFRQNDEVLVTLYCVFTTRAIAIDKANIRKETTAPLPTAKK